MHLTEHSGQRLAQWRKSRGLSQRQLGAIIGRSQGYIGDVELGRAEPSRDLMQKLAEQCGINPAWLISGHGSMEWPEEANIQDGLPVVAKPSAGRPFVRDFSVDGEDFSLVRACDIDASAGAGLIPVENDGPERWAFPTRWLTSLGVASDLAAVVRVRGDSMAPTITDGAKVLVDVSVRMISQGGIYVFTIGEEVFVKRCVPIEVDATGRPSSLVILSDNPTVPVMTLYTPDLRDLRVAGRVRAVIADL